MQEDRNQLFNVATAASSVVARHTKLGYSLLHHGTL
jgi:hypothetical protein